MEKHAWVLKGAGERERRERDKTILCKERREREAGREDEERERVRQGTEEVNGGEREESRGQR